MPCDVTLLVLPSGASSSTKFFACVAPKQIPAQTRRGLAAEHRPPALPKRIRRKRADARNRGRLCHRETLDDLRGAGFHCAPPLPNQSTEQQACGLSRCPRIESVRRILPKCWLRDQYHQLGD